MCVKNHYKFEGKQKNDGTESIFILIGKKHIISIFQGNTLFISLQFYVTQPIKFFFFFFSLHSKTKRWIKGVNKIELSLWFSRHFFKCFSFLFLFFMMMILHLQLWSLQDHHAWLMGINVWLFFWIKKWKLFKTQHEWFYYMPFKFYLFISIELFFLWLSFLFPFV